MSCSKTVPSQSIAVQQFFKATTLLSIINTHWKLFTFLLHFISLDNGQFITIYLFVLFISISCFQFTHYYTCCVFVPSISEFTWIQLWKCRFHLFTVINWYVCLRMRCANYHSLEKVVNNSFSSIHVLGLCKWWWRFTWKENMFRVM